MFFQKVLSSDYIGDSKMAFSEPRELLFSGDPNLQPWLNS